MVQANRTNSEAAAVELLPEEKKREDNFKALARKITGDGGRISKMILEVRQVSRDFHAQVDLTAACCVVHAILHGNTTPANDLIDALGDGMRRNAFRAWFLAKGPFRAGDPSKNKDEKANFLYLAKDRVKAYKADYEEDHIKFGSRLMANPAPQFKPEDKFVPFDFDKALTELIKRGRNTVSAQEKKLGRPLTKAEKDKIDLGSLDVVASLYEKPKPGARVARKATATKPEAAPAPQAQATA